jgi:hypothetical protein
MSWLAVQAKSKLFNGELMDSTDLLCAFREDTVDDTEPYLWDNSEVYRYMNDAYFMFVRLTGGIADATSEVTQIVATQDTPRTTIDGSIMRIRDAFNTTLKRPITVINVQDEDQMAREDYGIVYTGTRDPDQKGRPDYMVIGEEDGGDASVRWVNVPDANYNIQLTVERLPLSANKIVRSRQQFKGVREEHHYHLLKWMRHLAYRKQDADTFNLVKSDQERDDFIAYCMQAKNEKNIRKHKVRTVAYGGL